MESFTYKDCFTNFSAIGAAVTVLQNVSPPGADFPDIPAYPGTANDFDGSNNELQILHNNRKKAGRFTEIPVTRFQALFYVLSHFEKKLQNPRFYDRIGR
jgi:hypothetical protein